MAIHSASASREYASINMTPMIDILLVMLIIFMAIASTRSTGLDALVPQAADDHAQRAPENPVVLEIAPDGSYRLNSRAVAAAALGERLSSVYSRRGERVLFVKAAGDLEFATVAAALDIARGANVEHVALMPR